MSNYVDVETDTPKYVSVQLVESEVEYMYIQNDQIIPEYKVKNYE